MVRYYMYLYTVCTVKETKPLNLSKQQRSDACTWSRVNNRSLSLSTPSTRGKGFSLQAHTTHTTHMYKHNTHMIHTHNTRNAHTTHIYTYTQHTYVHTTHTQCTQHTRYTHSTHIHSHTYTHIHVYSLMCLKQSPESVSIRLPNETAVQVVVYMHACMWSTVLINCTDQPH